MQHYTEPSAEFCLVSKPRNAIGELNNLIKYSILCVLLTFYDHGNFHWWTIFAPPVFAYVIAYPLLYIPYYMYFRWIYTLLYSIVVVILEFAYIPVCIGEAALGGKIYQTQKAVVLSEMQKIL